MLTITGHTYANGETETIILADRTPRIPEGKGIAPIPSTPADARADIYGDLSATASGMVVGDVSDRTRDGEVDYVSAVDEDTSLSAVTDDGTVTVYRDGAAVVMRDGRPVRSRFVALGNDDAANGVRIVSRKGGVTYVRKGSASVQVWGQPNGYGAAAVCRCGYRADAPALARPANLEGPETYERASQPMRYVTTAIYAHLIYAH